LALLPLLRCAWSKNILPAVNFDWLARFLALYQGTTLNRAALGPIIRALQATENSAQVPKGRLKVRLVQIRFFGGRGKPHGRSRNSRSRPERSVVEGSAVRPAALSNPSRRGSRSNESLIKPLPPTRFSNAGSQHSFVQQNQPHRIDQRANLDSSDSQPSLRDLRRVFPQPLARAGQSAGAQESARGTRCWKGTASPVPQTVPRVPGLSR
jgi:hypothetical protein